MRTWMRSRRRRPGEREAARPKPALFGAACAPICALMGKLAEKPGQNRQKRDAIGRFWRVPSMPKYVPSMRLDDGITRPTQPFLPDRNNRSRPGCRLNPRVCNFRHDRQNLLQTTGSIYSSGIRRFAILLRENSLSRPTPGHGRTRHLRQGTTNAAIKPPVVDEACCRSFAEVPAFRPPRKLSLRRI